MAAQKGSTPWNKGLKGVQKSPFKGIKRPEFSGVNHPMYGKNHTKETIMKISETKKKLHQSPPNEYKFGKGMVRTKEMIEKSKQKMKGKIPSCSILNGEVRRGKDHPSWKGGLRGQSYLERKRFQKTMQKLVFERDNYTCQLCGVRGVDLQVDHIQSWAEYVELRFSMDNCRTLCAKCHYKITFGRPMPDNIKGWGHNLLKGGKQL